MSDIKTPISPDTVCGILWIVAAAGCVAGQGFIGFVGVVSGFMICVYLYQKSPNAPASAIPNPEAGHE